MKDPYASLAVDDLDMILSEQKDLTKPRQDRSLKLYFAVKTSGVAKKSATLPVGTSRR